MADTRIPTARLLQTIGAQKVEIDVLREQLAAREAELQALRDVAAAADPEKPKKPTTA